MSNKTTQAQLDVMIARRLKGAAPMLGEAVMGIQTIAEILIATRVERDTKQGSLPDLMRPSREAHLIGAIACLADRVYTDLISVLGSDGEGIEGEDWLCWGSPEYLSGEHFNKC